MQLRMIRTINHSDAELAKEGEKLTRASSEHLVQIQEIRWLPEFQRSTA